MPSDDQERHFAGVVSLCDRLRQLPAEIRSHSYDYEAFGSWQTLVRYEGVRLSIVFDGKESVYTLRRSSSQKAPDEWHETDWRFHAGSGTSEVPVAEIVSAVTQCVGDG